MRDITIEEFKLWAAKQGITLIESLDGLRLGDKVTFLNEYGVSFENLTVIGIADETYNFYNRRFFLNSDAYWFPHKRSELTKEFVLAEKPESLSNSKT